MSLPTDAKDRKVCPCCGQEKSVADFHASNRRAGCRVGEGKYVQSKCKRCQVLDKGKHRERNRAFLDEVKSSSGCTDCGYREYVFALDFHHVGEKSFSFGSRFALQTSLEVLRAEISKCVVVCAICHRVRHHGGANAATY